VEMKSVTSSQIAQAGYENGVLAIKFKSGGEYTYTGVPEELFQKLLTAELVGSFFGKHIKGKFEYKKVEKS